MNKEFKCWQVRFKEKGRSEQVTKHLGHLTEEEVIKFFGLKSPEIEWYDVQEITFNNPY